MWVVHHYVNNGRTTQENMSETRAFELMQDLAILTKECVISINHASRVICVVSIP